MRLRELWRDWGGLTVSIPGMFVGLVFSPVVLSVATILTVVVLILDPRRGIRPRWRAGLPRTLRSSLFWGLAGLYLVMLVGVWQTEEWGYLLERLRVKLPLLLLPLAWAGLGQDARPNGHARMVLCTFLAVVVTGVLVNYAMHFEEINALIVRAQPVPVPRHNHVRFSLLVALCAVIGLHGGLRYRSSWLAAVGGFLFLGLHLLAVRSGLVAAYVGVGVVLVWWAVGRGQYRMLALGLVALCALPMLAYLTVPTFRAKLQYMRYELLHRDPSEDSGAYSDTGRLTSIRLGVEVWRQHPLVGVGYGNLRRAMDEKYAVALPGVPGKRPHNQFISALASGGVVGFVVTLGCFLLLGFGAGRWRDPLYFALWMMLTLSCLVENTLETSVGVTLFTLMLLLFAYPPKRKPG